MPSGPRKVFLHPKAAELRFRSPGGMLGLEVNSHFLGRVESISKHGLLLGAHNRTLRNPTVLGARGEACIGRQKEKPQR